MERSKGTAGVSSVVFHTRLIYEVKLNYFLHFHSFVCDTFVKMTGNTSGNDKIYDYLMESATEIPALLPLDDEEAESTRLVSSFPVGCKFGK